MKNIARLTLFIGTSLSLGLNAQSVYEIKSPDSDNPFVEWSVGMQGKYAVGFGYNKAAVLYDLATHSAVKSLGCVANQYVNFHAGSTFQSMFGDFENRDDETTRQEVFVQYTPCAAENAPAQERLVYLKDPSKSWSGSKFRAAAFYGAQSDQAAADALFIQTDSANGPTIERLWDAQKNQILFETTVGIATLERNQAGDRLLILEAGDNGTKTWHYLALAADGARELLQVPYGHGSGFTEIPEGARLISPDGKFLTLLGSLDGTVHVYDAASGTELYAIVTTLPNSEEGSVKSYASYLSLHAMVLTLRDGEGDDHGGLFDLQTKQWILKPDQLPVETNAIFSPDGARAVLVDAKGTHLLDTATQKVLIEWPDLYMSPQFSNNSRYLVVDTDENGTWGHRLLVDARVGKVQVDYAFAPHEATDRSEKLNFSPDYKIFAITTHLYDPESGQEFVLPKGMEVQGYASFLAQGQVEFWQNDEATNSTTVGIYDLKTGTKVLSLDGRTYDFQGRGTDGLNRAVFSFLPETTEPPALQKKLYVYEFPWK